jgi:hypothetical protein
MSLSTPSPDSGPITVLPQNATALATSHDDKGAGLFTFVWRAQLATPQA